MFNQVAYEKYLSCVPLLKDDESGKYVCPICKRQYSSLGIKNHIKYHFGWESNIQENARIGRERKRKSEAAVAEA